MAKQKAPIQLIVNKGQSSAGRKSSKTQVIEARPSKSAATIPDATKAGRAPSKSLKGQMGACTGSSSAKDGGATGKQRVSSPARSSPIRAYLDVESILVGCLVTPTGLPTGPRGLHVTRVSSGIDDKVVDHCIPLAAVGYTDDALEPFGSEVAGGFIVYPVWDIRRPSEPEFMVACRFGRYSVEQASGCLGFVTCASAIIPTPVYKEHVRWLVPELARRLDLQPPCISEPTAQRSASLPLRLNVPGASRAKGRFFNPSAAHAIAAWLGEGRSLRLGRTDYANAANFIADMSEIVAMMPTRATVAFASGVGRTLAGLDIAHFPNRTLADRQPIGSVPAPVMLTGSISNAGPTNHVSIIQPTQRFVVDRRAARIASLDGWKLEAPLAKARAAAKSLKPVGPAARSVADLSKRVRGAPWLSPGEVVRILSEPDHLAELSAGVENGNRTTIDRVMLSAVFAHYASSTTGWAGQALLAAVAPADRRAASMDFPRKSGGLF